MEGILWKWTNYWNGWQTRWFVLDSNTGVLSYYKSADEANQGCKGSVKVFVCQIKVHSADPTRLDLVIPGEQHLYLRAPSPQERQKWVVALGSAKACVDMKIGDTKSDPEDLHSINYKKSELKLYCDLLMQQVHAIKNAANSDDGPEKLVIEEATSLLTATCDTFIKTLEEIMTMSSSLSSLSLHEPNLVSGSHKNYNPPQIKTSQQLIKNKAEPKLTRSLSEENR